MMPKWNGLEVPKLPRGVYLNKSVGITGTQLCANTDQFSTRLTNLAHISPKGEKWQVEFWGAMGGVGWTKPVKTDTEQEALDYAVVMLWLGEVKYTLDEGRVDVRYED
jgi:hypothetical protein